MKPLNVNGTIANTSQIQAFGKLHSSIWTQTHKYELSIYCLASGLTNNIPLLTALQCTYLAVWQSITILEVYFFSRNKWTSPMEMKRGMSVDSHFPYLSRRRMLNRLYLSWTVLRTCMQTYMLHICKFTNESSQTCICPVACTHTKVSVRLGFYNREIQHCSVLV